jgi:hypothetical protein
LFRAEIQLIYILYDLFEEGQAMIPAQCGEVNLGSLNP